LVIALYLYLIIFIILISVAVVVVVSVSGGENSYFYFVCYCQIKSKSHSTQSQSVRYRYRKAYSQHWTWTVHSAADGDLGLVGSLKTPSSPSLTSQQLMLMYVNKRTSCTYARGVTLHTANHTYHTTPQNNRRLSSREVCTRRPMGAARRGSPSYHMPHWRMVRGGGGLQIKCAAVLARLRPARLRAPLPQLSLSPPSAPPPPRGRPAQLAPTGGPRSSSSTTSRTIS